MKLDLYSDIIKSTKHRYPNYQIIEFDKFIFMKFGLHDNFIDDELISKYRCHLDKTYKNTRECFWQF